MNYKQRMTIRFHKKKKDRNFLKYFRMNNKIYLLIKPIQITKIIFQKEIIIKNNLNTFKLIFKIIQTLFQKKTRINKEKLQK